MVRRRWRIGLGVALTLIGASIGLDQTLLSIPSDGVAIWAAVALLVTGIASGCRNLIQRKIGYGCWFDPNPAWTTVVAFFHDWENPDPGWTAARRDRLSRLTATNGGIAIALVAAGCWFLAHPDNWVQLGATICLGCPFVAATFTTNDLLHAPGAPPRATDRIEQCRPVSATRRRVEEMKTAAPFLLRAYNVLVSRTPRKELSGCAVVLMLMFPMIAGAHLVALAPKVVQTIVPHKAAPEHRRVAPPRPTPRVPPRARRPAPPVAVPRPLAPSNAHAPSYEDRCGRTVEPGADAPPVQRADLRRVWLAFGGDVAGCADTARRVPGTDVYYVLGYRDGGFVAIAVAAPGRPAALLLGPPAELARRLAEAGQLRGASEREHIGEGDFHVIDTNAGAWVVIRNDDSSDSAYVQLPPGLADLWLRYNERFEPTWPQQAGSSGQFVFYEESDVTHKVATGFCVGDTRCELRAPGIAWTAADTMSTQAVTVERVLQSGPK